MKKRSFFEAFKLEDEGIHKFGDGIAGFTVKYLIWILSQSAVIRLLPSSEPMKTFKENNHLSHG